MTLLNIVRSQSCVKAFNQYASKSQVISNEEKMKLQKLILIA